MQEINVTASPYCVDCTGVSDAAPAIQAAINSLGSVGGRVVLPGGIYLIGGEGLTIPHRVHLMGHGEFVTTLTSNGADISIVKLMGDYCSLQDIAVFGRLTGPLNNSAIAIGFGIVGFSLTNVIAWGGRWGIDDSGGVDGVFYNVFPAGVLGAMQSIDGANKFQSCKFDTGALPSQSFGIYFCASRSALTENEFDQCDFSSDFPSGAVVFNDSSSSPLSIAKFTGCTFGGTVNLIRARAVMFTCCEMPPTNAFFMGAEVKCAVTGSFALDGGATYPGACVKAGNININ